MRLRLNAGVSEIPELPEKPGRLFDSEQTDCGGNEISEHRFVTEVPPEKWQSRDLFPIVMFHDKFVVDSAPGLSIRAFHNPPAELPGDKTLVESLRRGCHVESVYFSPDENKKGNSGTDKETG